MLSIYETDFRNRYLLEGIYLSDRLLASNELSKLISNARKLKVQELLITFPCMTKRSIENRLRCLSNKYAGVQNTNNLTEKQAIAIIQYVMGFDSELILGNG